MVADTANASGATRPGAIDQQRFRLSRCGGVGIALKAANGCARQRSHTQNLIDCDRWGIYGSASCLVEHGFPATSPPWRSRAGTATRIRSYPSCGCGCSLSCGAAAAICSSMRTKCVNIGSGWNAATGSPISCRAHAGDLYCPLCLKEPERRPALSKARTGCISPADAGGNSQSDKSSSCKPISCALINIFRRRVCRYTTSVNETASCLLLSGHSSTHFRPSMR